MNDPIVDEVRRARDAHAAMFNYDLDAIFRDIKEEEKASGLEFVSYPPRRVRSNTPGELRVADYPLGQRSSSTLQTSE